jgi:hypothetical protein
MEASSFLPHPVVSVINCDMQQGIVTNNANCVINWGPGNISLDPRFTAGVRLQANSPCIDAGTNALLLMSSNWTASITNDYEGVPRPLDGNGDGLARFDIGAYEVLLASADSNGDGIPDGWTQRYGLNPTDPTVAEGNPDSDPHTTLQEWIADTDPTNALSYFRIETISNLPPVVVQFLSSSDRLYSLLSSTNLTDAGGFSAVPGGIDVPGIGGLQTVTDTNSAAASFYRVNVKLP